jgi:isoleucyl-tRNA synthetase
VIPFTTEEIYRGLHGGGDASVHLESYPERDAARVDEALEAAMAAAQQAVGVGRALRQEARLRTRQPLAALLLHTDDDRADALVGDERLRAILAEELNVKEVSRLDDPLRVVELGAKPDFRALGPRFGKRAKEAAAVVAAMTPEQVLTLRRQGEVSLDLAGETTTFTQEEVQVVEQGVGAYVAGSDDGLTVALETTLTPELREEGLCREIINKVQNLRKQSGFAVADRIVLRVGGHEGVRSALERYGDRVTSETLAVFGRDEEDLPYTDSFTVDDVPVSIAIDRRVRD